MFQGPFSQLFYEDDQKISKQDFLVKINSVPQSSASWKKYKSNNGVAVVSSIIGGVGLAYWITRDDGESTTAPIIVTGIGFVIGSVFQARALKYQREAILSYNKNETSAYHVTPSDKGVGLTIHF